MKRMIEVIRGSRLQGCLLIVLMLSVSATVVYAAEGYKEAPMLAELVKSGKLPPIEERLPQEVFVATPPRIGKYGGTVRFGDIDLAIDMQSWTRAGFFLQNADGSEFVPDIAKSVELSPDFKSLIIKLRKGHKWSDGYPFTADDIIFWWEDINLNKELLPSPPLTLTPGGVVAKFVKVDDLTVRIDFAMPYPSIIDAIQRSAAGRWFLPKHALEKYHIKYNPKANDLAKEEGFQHWRRLLFFHTWKSWRIHEDPDVPSLGAWVAIEVTADSKVMVRNPYFHWVDNEGNQLPYIDGLENTLTREQEVHDLKVMSGQVDVASFGLVLKDFPLLKRSGDRGNYRAVLAKSLRGSELGLFPNLTTKDMVLREIFNDVRFRQALSLAIDREKINDLIFFGEGTPRQAVPLPSISFFKPEWENRYAEYNPDGANELLDEMGLRSKDSNGIRLRPDGKGLTIVIDYADSEGPKTEILELVSKFWRSVGIDSTLKPRPTSGNGSFYHLVNNNDFDFGAYHLDRSIEGFGIRGGDPYPWYPLAHEYISAVGWRDWILTDGTTGIEPPEEIKEWVGKWQAWYLTEYGSPEYERLGQEVFDYFSEQLFVIGTVGMAPWPQIYSKKLRNIPEIKFWGSDIDFFGAYRTPQWYIEE